MCSDCMNSCDPTLCSHAQLRLRCCQCRMRCTTEMEDEKTMYCCEDCASERAHTAILATSHGQKTDCLSFLAELSTQVDERCRLGFACSSGGIRRVHLSCRTVGLLVCPLVGTVHAGSMCTCEQEVLMLPRDTYLKPTVKRAF